MDMAIWLGLVRHLLTFGGGLLVTKGWLDAGMVEQVTGAIITLGGAAWSIREKITNGK